MQDFWFGFEKRAAPAGIAALAGGAAGAALGGYVAHRSEQRKGLDQSAQYFSAGNALGRAHPDKPIAARRVARSMQFSGPLFQDMVDRRTAEQVVANAKARGYGAQLTKRGFWDGFDKAARKLTSKARNALPDASFVFPRERRYPIHDLNHARNALARVAQNGTPSEQSAVRSAVHQKYPELKED